MGNVVHGSNGSFCFSNSKERFYFLIGVKISRIGNVSNKVFSTVREGDLFYFFEEDKKRREEVRLFVEGVCIVIAQKRFKILEKVSLILISDGIELMFDDVDFERGIASEHFSKVEGKVKDVLKAKVF